MIRGCGGHRDNPDVTKFRSSFRYIAVTKLFVDNSGRNCANDLDNVLLDISSLSNLLKSTSHEDKSCVSTSTLVQSRSERRLLTLHFLHLFSHNKTITAYN